MSPTLGDSLDQLGRLTVTGATKAKKHVEIALLIRAIKQKTIEFHDIRNDLVKKFGAEQPQGGYTVKPEEVKNFKEAEEELLKGSTEINIEPVHLPADTSLQPSVLVDLLDFIVFDNE